jgi:site-specific DNA-methyltransferase (adenine-specific)
MLKENPEYRSHPTQKPLAVMNFCLLQSPKDVKTVVDPYMGVGTTLVACKALGISCVGVEREEKYCADAVSRLRQEVFDFS